MMNKHTFALFYSELSTKLLPLQEGNQFLISNHETIYRITHVLRLTQGDSCIIFDRSIELLCRIDTLSKKGIQCIIISVVHHSRRGLSVTAILPLLKKEDFDSSLYALGAVGVEAIQIVSTEKTQRTWNKDKDTIRAQNILIAAAEQSKYFSMPQLHNPQPLSEILNDYAPLPSLKIVADPTGTSIEHLVTAHQAMQKAIMLVGPEGGLTEKEFLHACQTGFIPYRLTPTILKAEHAVTIMSGLLRSIFTKN